MEPTLLAHPDSAKSSPRLYWGLFLVLLTVISTLPSTPALAQRTTDKTELERMARQFQSQLDRGRTSVYYRLLRSTDPAQAQLNRDESIQLMFMRPSGMPAFYSTDNLNAARTISTDEVWPGGSTGFNRTGGGTASGDLAVWDAGGVRLTHQEFDGRVTQIDGPLGVHFHSNHVAGTMVAEGQDPAARGMSYTAPLDAYDWNSDFAEMTAAGAAGLQVSNHSYGFTSGWSFSGGNWYWYGDLGVSGTEEYGFGFYDANAQAIDQIAYNAPNYLICKSSGNDRDDNGPGPAGGHFHWSGGWVFSNDTHQADGASGGYDCIGWWGNAKNLLTVGAIQDIPGGYTVPGGVVQEPYSSWGPTDDGRIKPDIVANGEDLYSAGHTADNNYLTISGTSMATPNASGSINILANMFESRMAKEPHSATLKALVINGADEAGPANGPDYQNGWGLMNTATSATVIQANPPDGMGVGENTLVAGQTHEFWFQVDTPGPVRVTIAWTDPAGTPVAPAVDPATLMLVNDLDMVLERVNASSTLEDYDPWMLNPAAPANAATTGDNDRDNVEQIDIANAQAGVYKLTITHEGALTNGSQDYSLVWRGLQSSQPPTFDGAIIDMAPDNSWVPMPAPDNFNRRGVRITALKDMYVSGVGFKVAIPCPGQMTARIYEMTGPTTLGTLIAISTQTSYHPGWVFHMIPVQVDLARCEDYYVEVQFDETVSWPYWNENTGPYEPYDIGGMVRVHDGASSGNFGNFALPNMGIVATPYDPPAYTDLEAATPWNTSGDTSEERGIFVTPIRTMALCSLGFRANYGGTGAKLVAKVYEATGTTRGDLVATGSMTVNQTGMTNHRIPINATLAEGAEYDLVVEFPSTPWEFHTDTSTLPFTVSDVMIMRDGEYNGSASNTVHPHLEIGWVEAVAGANFDLAKIGGPHPPPFSTSQDNVDYGAFVTALLDQEIFSVGWKADVPAGQVVGVNIYDAAGIARGALITSGTVVSPKGGMRWHDVPIGASLAAGQDYDIEIDMNGVTTWRYWTDTAGPNPVPYDVFGSLRVVDSESGGGAGNNALIEMRVHACHATATSVPGDRPGTAPPSFALRAPYPNPVSGVSTVEYSLDEAGPVTIQVYDVRGRRVATLLNENRPAGFGSVAIQARSMPAGVYFVKMATNLKTVSRKVTIVR